MGGTAFRPISAGHGSACADERALGKSSKLSSFENDGGLVDGVEGDVCSSLGRRCHSGTETVLATAVERERESMDYWTDLSLIFPRILPSPPQRTRVPILQAG